MKELILIRHAKSSWKDSSLDDFDRPLNKRGKENAPFMAKRLKEKGLNPDLIISSPSLRTKLTLEYFLKEFNYKKDVVFENSIYEAPYENLLNVIKNVPNSVNQLFFIGHNPGLNDLSDFLLGEFYENIPTSGVLKIVFYTDSWKEISKNNSKLEFFEYPKMF